MNIDPPTGNDLNSLGAWARRVAQEITRFFPTGAELPTFASDTEAAAARLNIGDEYFTPDGFRKRRTA
jgi:hypothetical protein